MRVSVQVPDGWHTHALDGKDTKGLQISKELIEAKSFETGLTINLIERHSDAEFSAAIIQMGDYMAKLHDTFTKIVDSRITKQNGASEWILDGIRTLPNQEERGSYHTRTIVHILKPSHRIYMEVFGAPADRWATDFKIGKVMLNPIKIDVE